MIMPRRGVVRLKGYVVFLLQYLIWSSQCKKRSRIMGAIGLRTSVLFSDQSPCSLNCCDTYRVGCGVNRACKLHT